jgi:hypothetical protein
VVALPRIIAKRWPGSGVEGVVNCAAVVRGGAGLLDGSTASWVEMASTNVSPLCQPACLCHSLGLLCLLLFLIGWRTSIVVLVSMLRMGTSVAMLAAAPSSWPFRAGCY